MRASRRGFGVLAAVLAVLLILVVIAFAQALSRSSTTRTALRVTDVRSAFEVADSALSEAVVRLRENLDSGQTTPECPDDWRKLLAEAFGARRQLPSGKKIVPRMTRSYFHTAQLSSTVGDVSVEVVQALVPAPEAGKPPAPPQGVLELAVTVDVSRMTSRTKRTVRQRRSFHLTWPGDLPGAGDPASPGTQFSVLAHPLGTVVE